MGDVLARAGFVGGFLLAGIIRTLAATAIIWAIGFGIGWLARRLRFLAPLRRLLLAAPLLTAVYLLLGVLAGILSAASQVASPGDQPVVLAILRINDVLVYPMYLLWFLAGVGIPAFRRRRMQSLEPPGAPPTPPDAASSVALG